MNLQTRPWVSGLSLATTLYILYGFAAAILGPVIGRPFWIGFTAFAFGWFYLHHGHPGREFYSAPATATEYLAGPDDVYFDRSSYEDPNYDGYSGATYPERRRTANRKRLRYIANCIASVTFGVAGGMLGVSLDRRRRLGHALQEGG
ncbi:hypothetical protein [Stieleria varia]|nr:hypothetical protein [Stieleria varia]